MGSTKYAMIPFVIKSSFFIRRSEFNIIYEKNHRRWNFFVYIIRRKNFQMTHDTSECVNKITSFAFLLLYSPAVKIYII